MARLLAPGRLVLATHNAGKLREVAEMLTPYGLEVVSAGDLGLPEPEETGSSFTANALLKAAAASRATGLPALADDSGFSVTSLGGDPGVRTADWAIQPDGSRDYPKAMARVAELAAPHENRSARFTCVLALYWPDGHSEIFEGHCGGEWIAPPRGTGGFGYDPMFVPAGETRSFGEMTPAEKKRFSHRARAFALLAEACLQAPPKG